MGRDILAPLDVLVCGQNIKPVLLKTDSASLVYHNGEEIMLEQPPQPTPAEIEQRLRLMDFRLDQQFPGYLEVLEQLREPRSCYQEGEWSPVTEQWHTTWKGQQP